MTLILTALNGSCVVQVSDRLTVKVRNSKIIGQHDPCANKTIVYVAHDSYMAISFAGAAYVGRCPTDEWIARQLLGKDFLRFNDGRIAMVGTGRHCMKPINQVLWMLERAIATERSFRIGIEISIGGWRIRRKRLIPFLASIARSGNEVQKQTYMRMLRTKLFSRIQSSGQIIDFETVKADAATYPHRAAMLFNPATRSKFLAETIQQISITNQAVGSDVMAVELVPWTPNGPRDIVIRYRPLAERLGIFKTAAAQFHFPAAFWPWVITPFGYKAPSISTAGGQWDIGPITLRYECPERPPLSSNLFAESSIMRPLPPR
jgi:hypothetical protein